MRPLHVPRGIWYTSTGYAEEQRLRFVTLNEIDNFIRLLLHLRAAGFVLQQFAWVLATSVIMTLFLRWLCRERAQCAGQPM
jgi:hypothetical protein